MMVATFRRHPEKITTQQLAGYAGQVGGYLLDSVVETYVTKTTFPILFLLQSLPFTFGGCGGGATEDFGRVQVDANRMGGWGQFLDTDSRWLSAHSEAVWG